MSGLSQHLEKQNRTVRCSCDQDWKAGALFGDSHDLGEWAELTAQQQMNRV